MGTRGAVPTNAVAEERGRPDGTTRDTALLSAGTAVSRLTGVLRVVMVGAVLGPTYLGNAYEVSNSLPNLVYYGFLAGSLTSAIVVPALVRHLQAGRADRVSEVSGAVLGLSTAAAACVLPVAVLVLPVLLGLGAPDGAGSRHQADLARVLVLFTAPQILLYGVVGSATAVMYAHRRFVLPALAPAVENVGVISVLALFAWVRPDPTSYSVADLALLGGGSTLAVAAHASVQWWGAARCGVRLRPRSWRHDPEVRLLVRGALNGLGQAGLFALSLLVMMLTSSHVAGGAVALAIALNFYHLPVALVAQPIGLAVLPRLSALHHQGRADEFAVATARSLRLTLLVVVPAAVGTILVADQVVGVIAVGAMVGSGSAMTSAALAALAVGLTGQALFFVSSQACYARSDTRTPLRWMAVQSLVCTALAVTGARVAQGPDLVQAVAFAYAVASLVGGVLLSLVVLRRAESRGSGVGATLVRTVVASAVMALVVAPVVILAEDQVEGRAGAAVVVVLVSVLGMAVYAGAQRALRSPDLQLLRLHRDETSVSGVVGP